MTLRVQRCALLLAAIALSGCETTGLAPVSSQSPDSSSIISQTGTQTVRQRIQQLRSDQASLAAAISRQQGQLSATRAQISSEGQQYTGLVNGITSRLQSRHDSGQS